MAGWHVALLRGINVGRAKRVAMADLRTLVENLGYGDVRTVLNSGNIVFTAPARIAGNAAARIEKALPETLGISSRVIVLSAAELAAVVAGNPLLGTADNHSRLLVSVLADGVDPQRLKPLAGKDWGKERLAVGPRVAYQWCPDGMLASPLATAISRALGDAVTTRTWTTVTKLYTLGRETGR